MVWGLLIPVTRHEIGLGKMRCEDPKFSRKSYVLVSNKNGKRIDIEAENYMEACDKALNKLGWQVFDMTIKEGISD